MSTPVCKCGATEVSPADPDRCRRGHPLPGARSLGRDTQFESGNWAALKHAQRSERWPEELAVLKRDVDDFLAQALVDEGDEAQVSTRRRALLDYRGRMHRRIVQLDGMLEIKGLCDGRGRLRQAWLSQLTSLINTAKAIDHQLGLEKRQKRVQTLAEVLDGE